MFTQIPMGVELQETKATGVTLIGKIKEIGKGELESIIGTDRIKEITKIYFSFYIFIS